MQSNVLHLGDQAFVGYNLVKMLRDENITADYLAYESPEIHYNDWVFSFSTSKFDNLNKLKIIKESVNFCKRYNIIHAHSIFSIPLLFVKKPYVLHLHGSDVRVYAKKNDPLGLGLRKIIKNANNILVSTPDLLDDVKLFGKQATFLPNPINFDLFKPINGENDLHDGSDFLFFHPTRHSFNKGNISFIKAFSEIISEGYNAKLVMAEWGDSLHESKKLVLKLGISKNIEWIKHISNENMVRYYNSSDLVFDQFHLNGMGLVTFEAMACGKLPITKYSPQYVEQGYQILPPLSTIEKEADIAPEILKFIESNKLRTHSGLMCYDWVRAEHSRSKIINILKKVYRDLDSRDV